MAEQSGSPPSHFSPLRIRRSRAAHPREPPVVHRHRELDGRGAAAGAAVSPRLRAFHVRMVEEGPDGEQTAMMAEAFSKRCPIHTTLAPSAPIHITNVVMGVAQEAISTEADLIVDYDALDELELELGKPSASGVMFGCRICGYWNIPVIK